MKCRDARFCVSTVNAGGARRLVAVLLCVAAVAWSNPVRAQNQQERDVDKSGTTTANFLTIPVGARATAMGSAYSAVAKSATTMHWNPAGLATLEKATFSGEYATWLASVDHAFAGLALPTGFGTFGLSVKALRSPEMDVTDETIGGDYRTGETFRAASYAVGLSYARSLTDRFSLGGSAKYIYETIHFSKATGFAFDVGTLFETPFRGVRLGASITNFGPEMQMGGSDLRIPVPDDVQDDLGSGDATGQYETGSYDLPLTMRIGLAGEVFEGEHSRLTVSVDALHPNNNDEYINVGAELALLGELLMLRGGYNELFLSDTERSVALGGGLNYGFGDTIDFTVDYAYERHQYFQDVNRLTLSLLF